MDGSGDTAIYAPATWYREGRGPRYLQLYRHLAAAISSGTLEPDTQLPPERDLADIADVSRVTVRKAVSQLVSDGLIEQRRGAGSFVRSAAPRLEQSLSRLTSFTEYMAARGLTSTSEILGRGLFPRSQTNPWRSASPRPSASPASNASALPMARRWRSNAPRCPPTSCPIPNW